jgi:hypothetical protein
VTAAATSPAAAMLARLEAAELTPDLFGNSTELLPYLRAAAISPGFDLPADCLAVAEQGLHLAQLQQAHSANAPSPHQPGGIKRILAGGTPEEILDAEDVALVAKARHERAWHLLLAARQQLAGMSGAAFAPHRESLVTGPLREKVASLLAEAKAKAATLKKFAPDYGPALLNDGNPTQLLAYRASRQMNADLAVLTAAWRASWVAASKDKSVAREFVPQRAGTWYCWVAPDDVHPDAVRLGTDADILRLATVASTEYRLASPSEILAVVDQMTADLPQDAPRPARMIVRSGVCA